MYVYLYSWSNYSDLISMNVPVNVLAALEIKCADENHVVFN